MDHEQLERLLSIVRRPGPRTVTLDERLQLLEDEREIVGLVQAYAWLCDARRWDEIWAMYTDDFEREVVSAPSENVRGIADVRAMYTPLLAEAREANEAGHHAEIQVRGIVSPPIVRVQEDRSAAEVVAVYDVETRHGLAAGAPPEVRRVTYLWGLRPSLEKGWRFATLLVLTDEAQQHRPEASSAQ